MTKANVRSLKNSGFVRLNDDDGEPPAQRTYVVLGVARGGTTMVAKALHDLGIRMGEKLSAVYEDVQVSRAMEADDLAAVRAVIAERNAAHAAWGFKRPAAIRFIKRYERELRNPCYVVVFRDIFAVANRNRISAEQDLMQGLANAARDNVELATLVAALDQPALLVSYEKALAAPGVFVDELAEFAGVSDPALRTVARDGVEPGGAEYLEQSRVRRSVGRLERIVDNRIVKGWALMAGHAGPVRVRIFVNGKRVGVVKAGLPRPDLRKPGIPAGAECGFELELPDALMPGDRVRARVLREIKDLGNSPLVLPAGKPAPAPR